MAPSLVGHLEQHRICGGQAHGDEAGGHPVTVLVQLAVGQPAVQCGDRGTVRVRARDRVQLLGDGPGAPQARRAIAAYRVRRVGDEPAVPVLRPAGAHELSSVRVTRSARAGGHQAGGQVVAQACGAVDDDEAADLGPQPLGEV